MIGPLMRNDGKKVTGIREKVELLTTFFATVFIEKGKNGATYGKQQVRTEQECKSN